MHFSPFLSFNNISWKQSQVVGRGLRRTSYDVNPGARKGDFATPAAVATAMAPAALGTTNGGMAI